MDREIHKTIDDVGLSKGLYESIKAQGIEFVKEFHKLDFGQLSKDECVELLTQYAEFND